MNAEEVPKLRAALAKALQEKHEAIAKNIETTRKNDSLQHELSTLKNPNSKPCYFLHKIPVEIRTHIYKLLLVRDILSTDAFVQYNNRETNAVEEPVFELEIAILRTCGQIHDEAITVLYGSNVFFCELSEREGFWTPFHRNIREYDLPRMPRPQAGQKPQQPEKESGWCLQDAEKLCSRVKHWIVALDCSKTMRGSLKYVLSHEEDWVPRQNLTRFVRLIWQAAGVSLTVLLRPGWHDSGPCRYCPHDSDPHYELELRPLRLLRNLVEFEVMEVGFGELPDLDNICTSLGEELSPQLASELSALVKGQSPVHRVFLMFDRLLVYCQSFERSMEFAKAMEPPYAFNSDEEEEDYSLHSSSRRRRALKAFSSGAEGWAEGVSG